MVLTLSREEVRRVCSECERYNAARESCRMEAGEELKSLYEVRKCPKWDKFYGGSCLYKG